MKIVICGDSFSAGCGLTSIKEESFGAQLAKELNAEVINLAKGGASNYVTHLQAEFAIENLSPDLIIMSTTSFDRIDFLSEGEDEFQLTLRDVNYHGYSPYGPNEECTHYFANDPFYKPKLLTEGLNGLNYYLTAPKSEVQGPWFNRLTNERRSKLQDILNYHVQYGLDYIRLQQDISVIFKAYTKAIKKNIPVFVISDNEELGGLIEPKHLIKENWFSLALKWPDGCSGHTDVRGHKYITDLIIDKLKGL